MSNEDIKTCGVSSYEDLAEGFEPETGSPQYMILEDMCKNLDLFACESKSSNGCWLVYKRGTRYSRVGFPGYENVVIHSDVPELVNVEVSVFISKSSFEIGGFPVGTSKLSKKLYRLLTDRFSSEPFQESFITENSRHNRVAAVYKAYLDLVGDESQGSQTFGGFSYILCVVLGFIITPRLGVIKAKGKFKELIPEVRKEYERINSMFQSGNDWFTDYKGLYTILNGIYISLCGLSYKGLSSIDIEFLDRLKGVTMILCIYYFSKVMKSESHQSIYKIFLQGVNHINLVQQVVEMFNSFSSINCIDYTWLEQVKVPCITKFKDTNFYYGLSDGDRRLSIFDRGEASGFYSLLGVKEKDSPWIEVEIENLLNSLPGKKI